MREMAAGEHDPPVRLHSLVDCRSELRPDLAPRQGEQILGRVTLRHAQEAFRPPERIEDLMQAVDQHRRRRVALQDQPPAKLGQNGLARRKLEAARSRRYAHAAALTVQQAEISGPAAADMPIEPLRFCDGLETIRMAHRLGTAEQQDAILAQREVEQGDHLGLRRRPEIDEQVAARNHVEL